MYFFVFFFCFFNLKASYILISNAKHPVIRGINSKSHKFKLWKTIFYQSYPKAPYIHLIPSSILDKIHEHNLEEDALELTIKCCEAHWASLPEKGGQMLSQITHLGMTIFGIQDAWEKCYQALWMRAWPTCQKKETNVTF